jgi:hypothetical protein
MENLNTYAMNAKSVEFMTHNTKEEYKICGFNGSIPQI